MYRIVRDPIVPANLESIVRRGDGGIVTFVGIVRALADDGRPVDGLSYEAFEPMALQIFEQIAGEARGRFGDVALAMVHRIGDLAVGETAVAVLAAAPHRAEAFAACRFAIDELKERAPIWKRERYADGAAEWRSNRG